MWVAKLLQGQFKPALSKRLTLRGGDQLSEHFSPHFLAGARRLAVVPRWCFLPGTAAISSSAGLTQAWMQRRFLRCNSQSVGDYRFSVNNTTSAADSRSLLLLVRDGLRPLRAPCSSGLSDGQLDADDCLTGAQAPFDSISCCAPPSTTNLFMSGVNEVDCSDRLANSVFGLRMTYKTATSRSYKSFRLLG